MKSTRARGSLFCGPKFRERGFWNVPPVGTFPAIKKVVGGLEIATGFDKDRKEYGPGFVSAHAQSSAAEVSVIRPEGDTGLIAAGGGEAVFREAPPPGLRLSLHLLL